MSISVLMSMPHGYEFNFSFGLYDACGVPTILCRFPYGVTAAAAVAASHPHSREANRRGNKQNSAA